MTPTHLDLRYPGAFGTLRITSFPMIIVGAATHTEPLTMFGFGWWIACIACEFWLRRKVRSS